MRSKIILFLLGLIGLSGCDDLTKVAYGTPYINYKISGRVSDKAGNPIPKILVSQSYHTGVLTDAQGIYTIEGQDHFRIDSMIFTDKDGAENGGEFIEQKVAVNITEEDKVGGSSGSWHNGDYVKVLDVTMELREDPKQ